MHPFSSMSFGCPRGCRIPTFMVAAACRGEGVNGGPGVAMCVGKPFSNDNDRTGRGTRSLEGAMFSYVRRGDGRDRCTCVRCRDGRCMSWQRYYQFGEVVREVLVVRGGCDPCHVMTSSTTSLFALSGIPFSTTPLGIVASRRRFYSIRNLSMAGVMSCLGSCGNGSASSYPGPSR